MRDNKETLVKQSIDITKYLSTDGIFEEIEVEGQAQSKIMVK